MVHVTALAADWSGLQIQGVSTVFLLFIYLHWLWEPLQWPGGPRYSTRCWLICSPDTRRECSVFVVYLLALAVRAAPMARWSTLQHSLLTDLVYRYKAWVQCFCCLSTCTGCESRPHGQVVHVTALAAGWSALQIQGVSAVFLLFIYLHWLWEPPPWPGGPRYSTRCWLICSPGTRRECSVFVVYLLALAMRAAPMARRSTLQHSLLADLLSRYKAWVQCFCCVSTCTGCESRPMARWFTLQHSLLADLVSRYKAWVQCFCCLSTCTGCESRPHGQVVHVTALAAGWSALQVQGVSAVFLLCIYLHWLWEPPPWPGGPRYSTRCWLICSPDTRRECSVFAVYLIALAVRAAPMARWSTLQHSLLADLLSRYKAWVQCFCCVSTCTGCECRPHGQVVHVTALAAGWSALQVQGVSAVFLLCTYLHWLWEPLQWPGGLRYSTRCWLICFPDTRRECSVFVVYLLALAVSATPMARWSTLQHSLLADLLSRYKAWVQCFCCVSTCTGCESRPHGQVVYVTALAAGWSAFQIQGVSAVFLLCIYLHWLWEPPPWSGGPRYSTRCWLISSPDTRRECSVFVVYLLALAVSAAPMARWSTLQHSLLADMLSRYKAWVQCFCCVPTCTGCESRPHGQVVHVTALAAGWSALQIQGVSAVFLLCIYLHWLWEPPPWPGGPRYSTRCWLICSPDTRRECSVFVVYPLALAVRAAPMARWSTLQHSLLADLLSRYKAWVQCFCCVSTCTGCECRPHGHVVHVTALAAGWSALQIQGVSAVFLLCIYLHWLWEPPPWPGGLRYSTRCWLIWSPDTRRECSVFVVYLLALAVRAAPMARWSTLQHSLLTDLVSRYKAWVQCFCCLSTCTGCESRPHGQVVHVTALAADWSALQIQGVSAVFLLCIYLHWLWEPPPWPGGPRYSTRCWLICSPDTRRECSVFVVYLLALAVRAAPMARWSTLQHSLLTDLVSRYKAWVQCFCCVSTCTGCESRPHGQVVHVTALAAGWSALQIQGVSAVFLLCIYLHWLWEPPPWSGGPRYSTRCWLICSPDTRRECSVFVVYLLALAVRATPMARWSTLQHSLLTDLLSRYKAWVQCFCCVSTCTGCESRPHGQVVHVTALAADWSALQIQGASAVFLLCIHLHWLWEPPPWPGGPRYSTRCWLIWSPDTRRECSVFVVYLLALAVSAAPMARWSTLQHSLLADLLSRYKAWAQCFCCVSTCTGCESRPHGQVVHVTALAAGWSALQIQGVSAVFLLCTYLHWLWEPPPWPGGPCYSTRCWLICSPDTRRECSVFVVYLLALAVSATPMARWSTLQHSLLADMLSRYKAWVQCFCCVPTCTGCESRPHGQVVHVTALAAGWSALQIQGVSAVFLLCTYLHWLWEPPPWPGGPCYSTRCWLICSPDTRRECSVFVVYLLALAVRAAPMARWSTLQHSLLADLLSRYKAWVQCFCCVPTCTGCESRPHGQVVHVTALAADWSAL